MSQNLFEMFDTKEGATVDSLKSKLVIILTQHIRNNCNEDVADACEALDIDHEEYIAILRGDIDSLTLDGLVSLVVVAGYTFNMDFDPLNLDNPLQISIEK